MKKIKYAIYFKGKWRNIFIDGYYAKKQTGLYWCFTDKIEDAKLFNKRDASLKIAEAVFSSEYKDLNKSVIKIEEEIIKTIKILE